MFPVIFNQQPYLYSAATRPGGHSYYYQAPACQKSYTSSEPLSYKFNEIDENHDQMMIGKQVSDYYFDQFMKEYLEELVQKKQNLNKYRAPVHDPFFGGFAFYQPVRQNVITEDDLHNGLEAFSKHVFKNYRFSISKNSSELCVINSNNKVVKIFELPNSYENISIDSLTTLENGVAVIKLNLKKLRSHEQLSKKIQKKPSKKFENINVSALKEAYEKQLKEQYDQQVKKQEEEELEAKKIEEEKLKAKKIEEEKSKKMKEENLKAKKLQEEKLKAKKLQEEKLKAKKLEETRKEFENKKLKLKEQQDRMKRQAEKLKQKESELQDLYEKELQKLEKEAQSHSIYSIHSPTLEEDLNDSDKDADMIEESACSDESTDDCLDKQINCAPLKKKTSITVEDIEDQSDKEYRISLLNSPTSNAVLEGV